MNIIFKNLLDTKCVRRGCREGACAPSDSCDGSFHERGLARPAPKGGRPPIPALKGEVPSLIPVKAA